MTHEELNRSLTTINLRLAEISKRTENMGISGSAHTDNPEFVRLMTKFNELIEDSDKVTEKMAQILGE